MFPLLALLLAQVLSTPLHRGTPVSCSPFRRASNWARSSSWARCRAARRRIIPIVGGTFEGSGMKGRVLNNGADWQIVRADGLTEIDTRYALETDKGQIIYVQNVGMRHRHARGAAEAGRRRAGGSESGLLPHGARRSRPPRRSCNG